MKESTLLKIALIFSLIGILVLFIASESIVINKSNIDQINNEDINQDIRIRGTVQKVTDIGSVMYLDISEPKTISVVVFKDSLIEINENDYVDIVGMVDEYNGKLQLIANEIKVS